MKILHRSEGTFRELQETYLSLFFCIMNENIDYKRVALLEPLRNMHYNCLTESSSIFLSLRSAIFTDFMLSHFSIFCFGNISDIIYISCI